MPFAASLSEHPLTAEAVGEVVGTVLDRVGPAPDVAVLVASPHHATMLADACAAVRALLAPEVLIATTATTVVGGGREVEHEPALVLWAADLGGAGGGPVVPRRLAPGEDLATWADALGAGSTLVLLADPFTAPLDRLLDHLAAARPDVVVVGGLSSGATAPGAARLVLDGETHRDGAVAVELPPGVGTTTIVSQGCRPVGEPMIVTAAEGPVILELAGLPALDRLIEVAQGLGPDDRFLFEAGPQLGVVVDEQKVDFGTGDFLVRNVLGADSSRRGLVVGGAVEVGTTVQLQVRDAASATDEIERLLGDARDRLGSPAAALVFTCNGRGRAFFDADDHDAERVAAVAGGAVAGMACAGEVGPVGGRTHLHGYTASVLLLAEPQPD